MGCARGLSPQRWHSCGGRGVAGRGGGPGGGGGMPWHDLISPSENYLSWTIKIVKHKSLAMLVAVGFQGDQYIKRLIYIYISPTKLRTI